MPRPILDAVSNPELRPIVVLAYQFRRACTEVVESLASSSLRKGLEDIGGAAGGTYRDAFSDLLRGLQSDADDDARDATDDRAAHRADARRGLAAAE